MGSSEGRGRGSGKVILLGEHAVVYGVPAIAVGLDRGATARASFVDRGPSELFIGEWSTTADDGSDLGLAFSALLEATQTDVPVRVTAETILLPSAGLGCSAVLGVAITRALLDLRGIEESPEEVASLAMAWERPFHGRPSGIDTALAARGGCLHFQRGDGGPRVEAISLPAPLVLAIGHTGQPASTRAMVEAVAKLRARERSAVDEIFGSTSELVEAARLSLRAGDYRTLGSLLNDGQKLLEELRVSTKEIEGLCQIARENGALGAKLTGAGGGGCVIALVESSPEPILEAWSRAGFSGFSTTIEGIRDPHPRSFPRFGGRKAHVDSRLPGSPSPEIGGRGWGMGVFVPRTARAVAHPNIALAKYWGKLDLPGNLPAVPSLSVTLSGMRTVTRVRFDPAIESDCIVFQGKPASEREQARVVALLDRVREAARISSRALVETENDFPTAAGLASSASGFAALALASVRAAGLDWDLARVSDLARQSSASAARSLFGGFVALPAGTSASTSLPAEAVAPMDHWDLVVVVAVTTEEAKKVSSTSGMIHTAKTSPLYPAWVSAAPAMYERAKQALLARDLEALGAAMEQSAMAMHGTAMGADPPVVYFRPATIAALSRVRELRQEGTLAYATVDAGPHVKVLAEASNLEAVTQALGEVPGVERLIVTHPGPGARVSIEEEEA